MILWGTSLASGAWVVRIHYPDGRQGTFSIAGGKLQIGSDPEKCGLVIAGEGVARRHCSLTEQHGRLLLSDNGSTTGTWRNGQVLTEPTALRSGDQVRVGDHLLELLYAGTRIDQSVIANRLRHVPIPWVRSEAEIAGAVVSELASQAREWVSAGQPRAGLMRKRELHKLTDAMNALGKDSIAPPDLRAWAATSTRYRRLRLALTALGFAALVGIALITAIIAGRRPVEPFERAHGEKAEITHRQAPPLAPRTPNVITHQAVACETLENIAALYGSKASDIAALNQIRESQPLRDQQEILVRTERSPVNRWEERHLVEVGETWDDLARQYGLPESLIRRCNPELDPRPLTPGDEVLLWVEIPSEVAETSVFNTPEGTDLQPLPPSQFYARRCLINEFGAPTTIDRLVNGFARFRRQSRYRGEIVIGDISRRFGGHYGNHKSHHSGRDVDIWFPVRGEAYARGCRSCGTDYCRPEAGDVDWRATWQLIEALDQGGAVEAIFIERELQEELHAAARKLGVSTERLRRAIQWPARGTRATVQHADGHRRHMHVRFRCNADEGTCPG